MHIPQVYYSVEEIILWVGILLLICILGSKIGEKLGIPAILLFLFLGMLAGSDGPGGIPFDDPWIAQLLGVIALTYIIFSGALSTKKESIKPILWSGIVLSTIAVLGTALIVALIAFVFFKIPIIKGLLVGAIVSSTDAAAVFSILRAKKMGLKYNLKPLLEFESGSNDPMAAILSLGIIKLITDSSCHWHNLIILLVQQSIIGILFGYGFGKLIAFTLNKLKLEYEGLYAVLTLTMVLFIYGLTTMVNGSGFLAVYIAGLVIGNSNIAKKEAILQFHDGISWLMQIVMFLVFGLLVFPDRLPGVIFPGTILALTVIFIARPISVYISLWFSKMNFKEKTMVAWVGLRGATPLILATFPFINNMPKADIVFDIIFFSVIVSILIQAPTIPMVARWLGVAKTEKEAV
jgi:cell volume regulation protein A